MKEKTGRLSRVIALFVVISMLGVLVLTGCSSSSGGNAGGGGNSGGDDPQPPAATVTIKVDISAAVEENDATALALVDKFGDSTYEFTVEIKEGDTVLTATQNSAPEHIIGTQTGSYGTWVDSIDSLASSATTGWTFTVNGEAPEVGADVTEVADGDVIVWTYVTSW